MTWDWQTFNQIKWCIVPKKFNWGDRMIHIIPARFPRTWRSWSVPHACLLRIYLSLFPALVCQIMSRLSLSPLQSCRTVINPSWSALRVCLVKSSPLVFSESKIALITVCQYTLVAYSMIKCWRRHSVVPRIPTNYKIIMKIISVSKYMNIFIIFVNPDEFYHLV